MARSGYAMGLQKQPQPGPINSDMTIEAVVIPAKAGIQGLHDIPTQRGYIRSLTWKCNAGRITEELSVGWAELQRSLCYITFVTARNCNFLLLLASLSPPTWDGAPLTGERYLLELRSIILRCRGHDQATPLRQKFNAAK